MSAPDALYRISDLELASRLSFFLWSSIPDDELLDLAARGTLHTPTGARSAGAADDRRSPVGRLRRELRRAVALSARLRRGEAARRSPVPEFRRRAAPRDGDGDASSSSRRFCAKNRSVLDLLGADFTFLNDRLARHYGIPDVYGSNFRRVTLPPDSPRRGLLGQGSMLTVTSYANRTSPVNRGKFILETLLSMPPPPPPPDVPSLKDTSEDGHVLSMRARMEQHRANPVVRELSRADGSARLRPRAISTRSANGGRAANRTSRSTPRPTLAERHQIHRRRRDCGRCSWRRHMTRSSSGPWSSKMLTYALGRGIEPTDQPYIRAIMKDAAPGRYGLQTLVRGIVNSVPFQMRRGAW